MALTTDEMRAEAERLMSLDEHGRDVEALAILLQSRKDMENASEQLRRLDRNFLVAVEHGGGEIQEDEPAG